ncbi:putative permease [Candidatus Methanoperedens nitroreducens]|uniref:Probable membrane transporter protein n=1 Tax=Candidatus Methanoperedens nitratireducens TaxID=1392998 RepID=A0A062V4F7_9EURY|nr:sulfite exporter TauE/SafE family protein [Candidatus Methanoperedens nitroreducens]KCZ70714.1 putative permease [Candidatus Methanoperedens nitroreducens]MDJ1420568.1 sulfite exporter TauE/SafE family protein [Candidatus Methanoperedens sp.]
MAELLFFISAFIAEVIGTIVGFGSSTIFLPLALFFVDFKTALTLVAFFHIFGNLGRITFFRHGLDKKLILIFGIPSIILTVIGALLVNYTPQDVLKLVLGVFLLVFSITSIVKPDFKFKPSNKNAVIGGGLSGFLAGLIGTGGALRGAFLSAFNLKKTVYIATAAAIALAVDMTRIPIYFGSGFLEPRFYVYLPFLFIIAIAGSYTGKKIVYKIPQSAFRRLVLGAIALISLRFIYDGILFLL